jgi:hypothetical protein
MDDTRWLASLTIERQKALLDKHAAFWRREPGSGPLMGFAPRSRLFPLQNLDYTHEGRLHPADVTESMIQSDIHYGPPIDPEDDLLPGKIPLEPLAWAEGYCGANVFFSSNARTVWTKPYCEDKEDPAPIRLAAEPDWLTKLVLATQMNAQALDSAYLISESLLRGPADCLESIIGSSRLCVDLYDEPEGILVAMDWLASRVLELAAAQHSTIPRFHGGTINRYRIWAPGSNVVTQADVATLMSPSHFRRLLLPSYRRIARAFDTVTIHFHSAGWQHAEALMEVDEFAAIEWGMDPTGPTLRDMLPIFARILEKKCLILMNIETDAEVDLLLTRLPHEGLCIIRRKNYDEAIGTH